MISVADWNLENLKKIIPVLSGFKHVELFTVLLKEISTNLYDSKDQIIQDFSRLLNEFLQKNPNLKENIVKTEKWIECILEWILKKSKDCNGNY